MFAKTEGLFACIIIIILAISWANNHRLAFCPAPYVLWTYIILYSACRIFRSSRSCLCKSDSVKIFQNAEKNHSLYLKIRKIRRSLYVHSMYSVHMRSFFKPKQEVVGPIQCYPTFIHMSDWHKKRRRLRKIAPLTPQTNTRTCVRTQSTQTEFASAKLHTRSFITEAAIESFFLPRISL